MSDILFKQIDEMPDEVAAQVAPHLNLMFRHGSGFIGSDDVKDALKVVTIYTRRYARSLERQAQYAATVKPEETEASELG